MNAYTDLLDRSWADHLRPRAVDAPTVVSTFAGCGGSSLGYSMAGYRELLTVEWDEHAHACLRRNLPEVRHWRGDIAELDPDILGLAPGELDVLDGSPPCQGFSTAGLRRLDDPRNQLFREFVRLLDAWRPRVFVMENVKGLVVGSMRLIFGQILAALRGAGDGYRVTCRLITADRLDVPQTRQRVVFVGVREDLGLDPVHPAPGPVRFTVRHAIGDLVDEPGNLVAISEYWDAGKKQRELLATILPGESGGHTMRRFGKKEAYFNIRRLDWDRPGYTIVKDVRTGSHLGGVLHPSRHRFCSTHELARLQSFPDQYDWQHGSTLRDYKQVVNRIGNSVPPLMMRAVATTIRTGILDRAPVPT